MISKADRTIIFIASLASPQYHVFIFLSWSRQHPRILSLRPLVQAGLHLMAHIYNSAHALFRANRNTAIDFLQIPSNIKRNSDASGSIWNYVPTKHHFYIILAGGVYIMQGGSLQFSIFVFSTRRQNCDSFKIKNRYKCCSIAPSAETVWSVSQKSKWGRGTCLKNALWPTKIAPLGERAPVL